MRGSIIGITIGLGLLLGCAPDLAANEAIRCQESLECGADAVCYRGFCVTDDGTLEDAGGAPLDVADSSQSGATYPEHDAGITPATQAPSTETTDAGGTGASQPATTVPPQPGPSAPAPKVTQPMPAQGPTPMQPAPQSVPDAGPVVVDLPGSCTLADCCAEARRSLQGEEPDDSSPGGPKGDDDDDKSEPKAKKVKACGCADPGLLSGLLCGVLGPLGVLP